MVCCKISKIDLFEELRILLPKSKSRTKKRISNALHILNIFIEIARVSDIAIIIVMFLVVFILEIEKYACFDFIQENDILKAQTGKEASDLKSLLCKYIYVQQ